MEHQHPGPAHHRPGPVEIHECPERQRHQRHPQEIDLADTSNYSTGDLVKIADAGGAQYTVNGSFLKAGDKIIINATCQKPHSRDVVSPIQVTARFR